MAWTSTAKAEGNQARRFRREDAPRARVTLPPDRARERPLPEGGERNDSDPMNRECERNGLAACFARIVARALRCFRADPIVALVVDAADPLGAAIAEMIGVLGCGVLRSPERTACAPHAFAVGAASLADVRIIASGLATADRGLAAIGEARQTPGAAALDVQLTRARGSRLVLVTRGLLRVRPLAGVSLSVGGALVGGVPHSAGGGAPPC